MLRQKLSPQPFLRVIIPQRRPRTQYGVLPEAPQVATFAHTPYNQGDTTVAVATPTRSAPAGVMTDTKGRGSVFKLAHYVDW